MKSTVKLIILGLAVSLLLTLWIGSALAASYDLWVGGVQVNDSNKANILGDGTAQYDPFHPDADAKQCAHYQKYSW